MKNLLLFSVLAVIFFASCGEDDDVQQQQQEELLTVPVKSTLTTTTTNPGLTPLQALLHPFLPSESSDKSQQDENTITTVFEYEGRLITNKTETIGSQVINYTYYYRDEEAGLLDSIRGTQNGAFYSVQTYSYNEQGKISEIKIYNQDRELTHAESFFSYNGDYPVQVQTSDYNSEGEAVTMTGTVEFENGNFVALDLYTEDYYGVPYVFHSEVQYDDKNNPVINIRTVKSPMENKNNMLNYTTVVSFMGYDYQTLFTGNYTYNEEDFPITSHLVTILPTSTTISDGTYEYEKK